MNFHSFFKVIFFSIWVLVLSSALVGWAGVGSVPTTTGLDLATVSLQVISPPEYKEHLSKRVLKHFAKAGISWDSPLSSSNKQAVLLLRLKPEPLGQICPGKFLYEPKLVLEDKVIIVRKEKEAIESQTWSSQRPPHIIPKMSLEEFESELDMFIANFIVNYQLGQSAYSEHAPDFPTPSTNKSRNTQSLDTHFQDAHKPIDHKRLEGLILSQVKFTAWAGKDTKQIDDLAKKQLAEAGLRFDFTPDAHASKTMKLKLHSWPAREECPNALIYEATLRLVEHVQIQRNPKIYIPRNTWSRRKLKVLDAVSLEQLKADQEDLIADFISSFQAVNVSQRPQRSELEN